MPTKNIGLTDRVLRGMIAVLLLALAWTTGSWIVFFISLFVFFETFASWCVLYQILGKSSCPRE
jgi:hypothetical protein